MSDPDFKESIDTDAVAQMLDDETDSATDETLLIKIAQAANNYTRSLIPKIRVFGNDDNNQT